jgi:cell division protein FtsL
VSLPARRLEPASRPSAPRDRARPIAPAVDRRPVGLRPRSRPTRRRSIGFVVLASTIVGSMVFGIVIVNVLLAQTSFRIGEAERHLVGLSEEHLELAREQATLSAPGRVSAWASRHGMRLPDDIRILHAPGTGSADPAGAGTSSQMAAPPSGSKGEPPT